MVETSIYAKIEGLEEYNPMEKSLTKYNYDAAKKKENALAIREYGFSNIGELRSIKKQKVEFPQWVRNKIKGSLGQLAP